MKRSGTAAASVAALIMQQQHPRALCASVRHLQHLQRWHLLVQSGNRAGALRSCGGSNNKVSKGEEPGHHLTAAVGTATAMARPIVRPKALNLHSLAIAGGAAVAGEERGAEIRGRGGIEKVGKHFLLQPPQRQKKAEAKFTQSQQQGQHEQQRRRFFFMFLNTPPLATAIAKACLRSGRESPPRERTYESRLFYSGGKRLESGGHRQQLHEQQARREQHLNIDVAQEKAGRSHEELNFVGTWAQLTKRRQLCASHIRGAASRLFNAASASATSATLSLRSLATTAEMTSTLPLAGAAAFAVLHARSAASLCRADASAVPTVCWAGNLTAARAASAPASVSLRPAAARTLFGPQQEQQQKRTTSAEETASAHSSAYRALESVIEPAASAAASANDRISLSESFSVDDSSHNSNDSNRTSSSNSSNGVSRGADTREGGSSNRGHNCINDSSSSASNSSSSNVSGDFVSSSSSNQEGSVKAAKEVLSAETRGGKEERRWRLRHYFLAAGGGGLFVAYGYLLLQCDFNVAKTEWVIGEKLRSLLVQHSRDDREDARDRAKYQVGLSDGLQKELAMYFLQLDLDKPNGVRRSDALALAQQLGFATRNSEACKAFVETGSGRTPDVKRLSGTTLQEFAQLFERLLQEVELAAAEAVVPPNYKTAAASSTALTATGNLPAIATAAACPAVGSVAAAGESAALSAVLEGEQSAAGGSSGGEEARASGGAADNETAALATDKGAKAAAAAAAVHRDEDTAERKKAPEPFEAVAFVQDEEKKHEKRDAVTREENKGEAATKEENKEAGEGGWLSLAAKAPGAVASAEAPSASTKGAHGGKSSQHARGETSTSNRQGKALPFGREEEEKTKNEREERRSCEANLSSVTADDPSSASQQQKKKEEQQTFAKTGAADLPVGGIQRRMQMEERLLNYLYGSNQTTVVPGTAPSCFTRSDKVEEDATRPGLPVFKSGTNVRVHVGGCWQAELRRCLARGVEFGLLPSASFHMHEEQQQQRGRPQTQKAQQPQQQQQHQQQKHREVQAAAKLLSPEEEERQVLALETQRTERLLLSYQTIQKRRELSDAETLRMKDLQHTLKNLKHEMWRKEQQQQQQR